MDIKEIKEKKADFEKEIQKRITEFSEETGLFVKSISFDRYSIKTIDGTLRFLYEDIYVAIDFD